MSATAVMWLAFILLLAFIAVATIIEGPKR